MSSIDGLISFDQYSVTHIKFDTNDKYGGEEVQLIPLFRRRVEEIEETNSYIVSLEFKLAAENEASELPFFLDVGIQGVFSSEETDQELVGQLINENGAAILFPYLRALISTVTVNANISPLTLPTINIIELFKNEKADKAEH